jgi:predicted transcriptional regulator
MAMAEETEQSNTLELATELTIAWLSNPNTGASADDVPAFLQKVHNALNSMASSQSAVEQPAEHEYTPAVTVRKSLASKDHIISLIDGKPYKTLRRHLSRHGLTPDDYRKRYGLKADYPIVSESYSQVRRDMAKKIGLGRKPGPKVQTPAKSAATVKPAKAVVKSPKDVVTSAAAVKPAKAAVTPGKLEVTSAKSAVKPVKAAVPPAKAAATPVRAAPKPKAAKTQPA